MTGKASLRTQLLRKAPKEEREGASEIPAEKEKKPKGKHLQVVSEEWQGLDTAVSAEGPGAEGTLGQRSGGSGVSLPGTPGGRRPLERF